ncbi:MAG: 2-oxoacid:acceptor oxidoreductase family protein [Deltaproteobacteria bacterium]|nr:2-oxoacid:acceptor oxidoreductase family protein [Deltaproteobacteria bacterium]
MTRSELTNDPYNVIITGVGGQGNVLASKVLGNILASRGLDVTIGHLRISAASTWSPQIPRGMAHVIIAIEPIEALRVLSVYGNPETLVISNDRPVHPVGVISGEMDYPEHDDIRRWLTTFSRASYIIPATDEAVKLGAPILGNIILLGALSETHTLPFGRADFSEVISLMMPADKVEANLKAFDLGTQMVNQ